jgi:hypothetical protein
VNDLTVLALGAGVQSTALFLLAHNGDVTPRPDYAVFADTQQEPPWVYENLDRLEALGSIPIIRATAGDIGAHQIEKASGNPSKNYASVPFWTSGPDGGRARPVQRQCTREYKIDVVTRTVRGLLGLAKGERYRKGTVVHQWIGISIDEAYRAKPSKVPYIENKWPMLFDRPMSRWDCERYIRESGFPVPSRSACIFCPFRKSSEYDLWRQEHPELFAEACRIDEAIRSGQPGFNGTQYVLRDLVPLRDVAKVARPNEPDLFGNECEGMCGL